MHRRPKDFGGRGVHLAIETVLSSFGILPPTGDVHELGELGVDDVGGRLRHL